MQPRKLNTLGFKLLVVAMLALLVNGLVGSPAARAQEDPLKVVTLDNGFQITFMDPSYDEEAGTSTWTYAVEELPEAKDLSNWVLELPYCAGVIDAGPEPWEIVHPDPNALLSGIKWETGDGFEAGEFTLTVEGLWEIGETQVAAKGPDVAYGTIYGPDCEQNQAPVAVDDEVTTYQDLEIIIPVLQNDTDPDGDLISLVDFDAASQESGVVELVDNGTPEDASDDTLRYTPPTGFTGLDTFVYSAGDGSLTDTATVSVTVIAEAAAPIANPDTFIVRETPFSVSAPGLLLNDQLLGYSPVTIVVQDQPISGTLEINDDGSFTYTAGEAEFVGQDTFTYYLEANGETSNLATVTLHVPDEVAPTIEWTSPVPEGKVVELPPGQTVRLEVHAADNHAVDRVEFFRWNAAAEKTAPIAEVTEAPYAVEVGAGQLEPGYNQVYAAVYDDTNNRSDVKYIWVYQGAGRLLYLPLIR